MLEYVYLSVLSLESFQVLLDILCHSKRLLLLTKQLCSRHSRLFLAQLQLAFDLQELDFESDVVSLIVNLRNVDSG